MQTLEIVIWSAMLGGLLTLAAMIAVDALSSRSYDATRNLIFFLCAASACVIVSGLPERVWPDLPQRLMLVLKAGLGPLSGAAGLYFQGLWLGGAQQDRIVHRLTAWTSWLLLAAAAALSLQALQTRPEDVATLLGWSGVATVAPAVFALVASARSALLGDLLARWMTVANVLLITLATGHYLHALGMGNVGLSLLTAVATLAFFPMASLLVMRRNRQTRELARLAQSHVSTDPATGLSTGSLLLSQMDDMFWRTARINGECTVACLVVNNLYELSEVAGRGVENRILTAMAARLRRAAGVRALVGQYHPRCFVVVYTTPRQTEPAQTIIERIRALAIRPLEVMGENQKHYQFKPQLGLSVQVLSPLKSTPQDVLHQAERQAMVMALTQKSLPEDEIVTTW